MKVFSEREEHQQMLEGLKIQSIFKNQQVGPCSCDIVDHRNWEKEIQDGRLKRNWQKLQKWLTGLAMERRGRKIGKVHFPTPQLFLLFYYIFQAYTLLLPFTAFYGNSS